MNSNVISPDLSSVINGSNIFSGRSTLNYLPLSDFFSGLDNYFFQLI